MTEEEAKEWALRINQMSHIDLVRAYRFTPAGHPVFLNTRLQKVFDMRLKSMGGITSAVSKTVGWEGTSPWQGDLA